MTKKRHFRLLMNLLKVIIIGIVAISIVAGVFALYVIDYVKPYNINLDNVKLELTDIANLNSHSGVNQNVIATLKVVMDIHGQIIQMFLEI